MLLFLQACCETHNGRINAYKKSTTLEIIYGAPQNQRVDTIMISNFVIEHALSSEIDL
ncbi:hypothetical protein Geoth_3617 [Parageobacillus thermoglucosidasius C56-YS93]|nr:hypothetical protein Geoth_3617 [Parageobacillus thermoglucosidasius C56-YS93]